MTISVHQSTATADLQVSGKALSEGEAGLKDGAETGSADNVFSNLLSTLTGSNKSAQKASAETDASVAKMAEGAAKAAESALDAEAGNANLALVDAEAAVTSESTVEPISGEKGETESENRDDFLARLEQSAQLLQTPAKIMPQTTAESLPGDGVALPDTSGNGLPSLAATGKFGTGQQAKLAGGNVANNSESPLANSAGDVTLSEGESLAAANQSALSTATPPELKTEIANQTEAEQLAAAESGLNLQGLPTGVARNSANPESLVAGTQFSAGQQTATQVFDGARSGGKNKPLESLNSAMNSAISAKSANLAAATEQDEVTDSADAVSTDKTEQVDFAQLMDSVRKQEQPELAPRVITKAPVLTEAEQQVLDKRVNLHNNSASSELHEKISIMAGKELQTATIRLDPAELGSLNIKLVVHNDQASVIIQAQNGQSRDLLEQQLPRLREMLQQQGIALGDTQVQADSGGQQQSSFQQSEQQSGQRVGQNNGNNSANYAVDSQTEVPMSTQYWQDSAKGVDFYA